MTFAERFNLLYQESEISQEEFGKRFGANKNQVYNWRTGSGEPSTKMLVAIADNCGVSVDWLCCREQKDVNSGEEKDKNELLKTELLRECEKLSPAQQRHVLAIIKTFTAQSIAAEEKPKNRHSLTK